MSLTQFLACCLPDQEQFEILHLQNPANETHPIITTHQNTKNLIQITIKNQHFFTLFYKKKAIFALEIYVYITLFSSNVKNADAERTIFISKADTNGYCDCHVSFKKVTKQLILYLLSIDPNSYLQRVIPKHRAYHDLDDQLITKKTGAIGALRILARRLEDNKETSIICDNNKFYKKLECGPNIITSICLFTRPSPQYLFAESSKNPKKHILSGSDLLKWWLSVLDEIVVEVFDECTEATLRIPGEDKLTVSQYLKNLKHGKWKSGDIFTDHSREQNELAVFTIPLFPDDPKSRFLHQLVHEDRIKSTSVANFWAELQERQEFRLSVTVSVIGVSGFTVKPSNYKPDDQCDVFLTSSKKQFKSIKAYITGEEYDTVEGAEEAYLNVRAFLEDRCDRNLVKVTGNDQYPTLTKGLKEKKRGIMVTTLSVRKKPKN